MTELAAERRVRKHERINNNISVLKQVFRKKEFRDLLLSDPEMFQAMETLVLKAWIVGIITPKDVHRALGPGLKTRTSVARNV